MINGGPVETRFETDLSREEVLEFVSAFDGATFFHSPAWLEILTESFPDVRVIGSTDLTHHGGHFPAPGGHGKQGVEWSVANDRRLLDLIVRDDGLLPVSDLRSKDRTLYDAAVLVDFADNESLREPLVELGLGHRWL